MNEYELMKLKDCVFTIEDNLNAIKRELLIGSPFKGYILEKIQPILNDVNVIMNICKKEND